MIARSAKGWALIFCLAGIGLGCGVGPKTFRDLKNPAPIVRARAAGLDGEVPLSIAVPALIERLEDPDGVVRMSANETLRKRTGQDFGFVAWADPSDRVASVQRWRSWWQEQQQQPKAGLVKSRRKP